MRRLTVVEIFFRNFQLLPLIDVQRLHIIVHAHVFDRVGRYAAYPYANDDMIPIPAVVFRDIRM